MGLRSHPSLVTLSLGFALEDYVSRSLHHFLNNNTLKIKS